MAPGSPSRGLLDVSRLRRRKLADRAARVAVTGGGLAIIASIAGILLFIVAEVAPLGRPASVTVERTIPAAPSGAVVVDEYRSHAASLGGDGVVRVWRSDGTLVAEKALLPGAASVAPTADGAGLAASAGSVVAAMPVSFETDWQDGVRTVTAALGDPIRFDAGTPVRAFHARLREDGGATVAAALATGGVAVFVREVETNEISGERTVSERRNDRAAPPLDALVLDDGGENLYASAGARILWWGDPQSPAEPHSAGAAAPITALAFLLGERAIVAGDARGAVGVWFPVRKPQGGFELREVRRFRGETAVRALAPSPRDKGFFALEEGGRLRLHHSTSERTLWSGRLSEDAAAIAVAPKADGAVLAGGGGLTSLAITNPHPEISLRALFGKVWYEGYDAPAWVWQSTGGTDDFEPKLSLVPLLFGTVKGTLYSLLLAIPLAVFGAMYTSQFMHPRLRSWVKPAVELMAALPSVVLGFLAGLWLAPRLDAGFPALLLGVFVVPVFVIAGGAAWSTVPRTTRQRFFVGSEVVVFGAAIVLGAFVCSRIAPWLEHAAFGGTFRGWVTGVLGLSYDQRNAVVVGLAMGFAVIPIIFAIAEDAFTNVPASLTSASLALGANRWQTVSRVVLPAASPGIFSGVMVGFGRAVGETMIVLMATGNTPIMDWNPFNGFRTLSANIAVEIPEAPQGGTLYRTLFLAALLLFVMTFLVNTVAEVVRQRLRRKYSEVA